MRRWGWALLFLPVAAAAETGARKAAVREHAGHGATVGASGPAVALLRKQEN